MFVDIVIIVFIENPILFIPSYLAPTGRGRCHPRSLYK